MAGGVLIDPTRGHRPTCKVQDGTWPPHHRSKNPMLRSLVLLATVVAALAARAAKVDERECEGAPLSIATHAPSIIQHQVGRQ